MVIRMHAQGVFKWCCFMQGLDHGITFLSWQRLDHQIDYTELRCIVILKRNFVSPSGHVIFYLLCEHQ